MKIQDSRLKRKIAGVNQKEKVLWQKEIIFKRVMYYAVVFHRNYS